MKIDKVLSYFSNIMCGIPLCSVFGHLKLCLHVLPPITIWKHHKIVFHVYSDHHNVELASQNHQRAIDQDNGY